LAYGLTYKTTELLCEKLAKKLRVREERVRKALGEITAEEVFRVASNTPED